MRAAIVNKMNLKKKKAEYEKMLESDKIKITLWGYLGGPSNGTLDVENSELFSTEFIKTAIKIKLTTINREIEKIGNQIKEKNK